MMNAKAIPLSIAVVTGGTYSQAIIGEVQGWINAGWDINTHSVSHEYWNPPSTSPCDDVNGPIPCDAFLLAYVGPGTYTMSITHSGRGRKSHPYGTSPYDATCYHSWNLTPVPPGGTAGAGQIDTLADSSRRCRHSRLVTPWALAAYNSRVRERARTRPFAWRTRFRVPASLAR